MKFRNNCGRVKASSSLSPGRISKGQGKGKRMKKGFLFILGAGVLFFLGNARGETFDSFRGVQWGADQKSLSGLLPGPHRENVEVFTREEKKTVGEIEVENIYYLFYRGKFGAAMITFRGSRNSSSLQETLHQKYGPSQKPEPSAGKFVWELADLKILFQVADQDHSGSIDYFFKPVVQQREEDKAKAGRQDTRKRIDDL
jgi:hypothetical protein